jgi:hypothetical protein
VIPRVRVDVGVRLETMRRAMRIPKAKFDTMTFVEFARLRSAYVAGRQLGVFGVPANDEVSTLQVLPKMTWGLS